MKTILAILLLTFSSVATAGSYIIQYHEDTHSIVVSEDTCIDKGRWTKTTYLVGQDGKVEGTDQTIAEFFYSITK